LDQRFTTAILAAAGINSGSRRALGAEQVPEILTTLCQQTKRERAIVGLWCWEARGQVDQCGAPLSVVGS
jgi:hypothetical protein